MQKIISLFQRNYDGDRLVRDEVTPGAEWVVAGEGIATEKYDGTAVMVRAGRLFKRYDCKHGKKPPVGFEPCQEPDPLTGHWPGWLPIGVGPEDRPFRDAWDHADYTTLPDGTYELIGPKFQGNPYRRRAPDTVRTSSQPRAPSPTFAHGSRTTLIVRASSGQMVKVKRRDFGLPWPVRSPSGAMHECQT